MNRVLPWLLSCLLLWTAAVSAAPTFPALSGRVVDEANLMSRKQAHQLTQQLATFEKRSGIQLVVVSIDTLAGDTIEEYGYQLGRHWGIGQKGKDNGVLLLIAQDERKVRIEVATDWKGPCPTPSPPTSSRPGSCPRSSAATWWPGWSPAARRSCRRWRASTNR